MASYDESDGVWRTVGGRRIFIREGQSLGDAMKASGKFKKASKVKRSEYQTEQAKLEKEKADQRLKDLTEEHPEAEDIADLKGKHINEEDQKFAQDLEKYNKLSQEERVNKFVEGKKWNDWSDEEKEKSSAQIEKEFPYNFSKEVEEQAHMINTRSYDDIDDIIQDFAKEQGIAPREAKYAILKDEFKTRQDLYMDARKDGSYSDSQLNHMELMAKDSYFKLQEAQKELDSFKEANKQESAKKTGNREITENGVKRQATDEEEATFRKIEETFKQDQAEGKVGERLKSIQDQERYDRQYDKYKEQGYSDKEITDKLGERPKTGLEKGSEKTYAPEDLEQGKPYEIDMGNGIKKTAIYMGKDEEGNSSFYDGEGVGGTFGFSDKFMKENIKISDNKDDDKFMELHNQIKKETAPGKEMKDNPYATNNKGGSDDNSSEFAREARDYWDNKNLDYKASHDGKEDEMAVNFRDRWDKELKNREYGEKKASEKPKTYQEYYGLKDNRNEMTVKEYEDGNIDQQELKDMLRRGGESEDTIHKIVKANTGANSRDERIRNLFNDTEKEKAEYARGKAEEYKNTKDPMFQDVKEERAKGYEKQAKEAESRIDQSSKANGLNSKADYEHDLRTLEDLEKKYPSKGGLKNNEDYQSLKAQYESEFKTKWNSGSEAKETPKYRWQDDDGNTIKPGKDYKKLNGGNFVKQNEDGSSTHIASAKKGDGSIEYTRYDYDKDGNDVGKSRKYKSLEEAKAGKTGNEAMNEKIRTGASRTRKSAYQLDQELRAKEDKYLSSSKPASEKTKQAETIKKLHDRVKAQAEKEGQDTTKTNWRDNLKEPGETSRKTTNVTNDYNKFMEQMRNAEKKSNSGEFLENNKQWVENIGEKPFKYLTNKEKEKVLNGTMSVGEAYDKGETRRMEKEKATSMNDTLRRKAYNKYMKEHPNSKKTFEDFMKK